MLKLHVVVLTMLIAFSPAMLSGETGAVAGPMLGYVPDAAGGVRPILGVPGASLVGNLLPYAAGAALVEISPAQDYALAVDPDGLVLRIEFGSSASAPREVEGAMRSPARIIMSPGGRAALLLRGRDAQVVLSGAAANPIDLSALPGEPTVFAVGDQGAVLCAMDGRFYVADSNGLKPLVAAADLTAVAFTPDGRSAIAAGPGQLGILENIAGEASWRLIAALDDDFGAPTAVAAFKNRAVVAGTASVAVVELESGAATRFAAAPTTLARLQGEAIRLTGYSAGPMWMLDLSGEPRLLFIPPAALESEEVAQ